MALRYLADTSVLTRLSIDEVRSVVEPLVDSGEVARAGITDLEIGYSARNARAWDRLMKAVDVFPVIETTSGDVRRALQVQRLLAARSQRGRKIPDLLIAAGAERAGLVLLHYDGDFDQISRVTGQVCEWVLPAGSVA